jgi:trigger factor
LGLKPGDERVLEYTYAEDAYLESLRGTTAIFRTRVEDIKQRKLPELNDDFAKSVGDYETFETLQKAVRESLEKQAKKEYDEVYDQKVVTEILKDAQIKYPALMLENETDLMMRQLKAVIRTEPGYGCLPTDSQDGRS